MWLAEIFKPFKFKNFNERDVETIARNNKTKPCKINNQQIQASKNTQIKPNETLLYRL
jgi:hypothetical protein